MNACRHEALAYTYLLLNQIGTYTSYLAVVALSQGRQSGLFSLSLLFTARHLGGAVAYRNVAPLVLKLGEKSSLVYGNIAAAACLGLIAFFSRSFGFSLIALVIIGFLDNFLASGFHSFNGKAIAKDRLLRVNHNLQVLEYITCVVGATIGGSLIQYSSLKSAFIFDGASFGFCGLLVWFLSDGERTVPISVGASIPNPIQKEQTDIPAKLRLLLILEIIIALVIGTFNFVEIPYYTSVLGLAYSKIGPFFAVSIVGSSLAAFVLDKVKQGQNQLRTICALTGAASITFLGLGVTGHLVPAGILVLLFTGLLSLVAASSVHLIQTGGSNSLTPKVMAMRIAIKKAVFIVLTPLAGFSAQKFGLEVLMIWTAALYAFLSGSFLVALRASLLTSEKPGQRLRQCSFLRLRFPSTPSRKR